MHRRKSSFWTVSSLCTAQPAHFPTYQPPDLPSLLDLMQTTSPSCCALWAAFLSRLCSRKSSPPLRAFLLLSSSCPSTSYFPHPLLQMLSDVTRGKVNTCATNLADRMTKELILHFSALVLKHLYLTGCRIQTLLENIWNENYLKKKTLDIFFRKRCQFQNVPSHCQRHKSRQASIEKHK